MRNNRYRDAEAAEDDAPPRPREAGTVTRLVAQKKNALRVSVFLDEVYAFGLYQDVLVQHGLRKGQHLSVPQQEAMLADDARFQARSVALGYLSHRARTRAEVQRRLAQAGTPDTIAEETLDWLTGRGYLDDAAYARQYAESRMRGSGYGPQRIKHELARRGVARSEVEAALLETVGDAEVRQAAQEQAEARWKTLAREPDPYKRRRKLSDFLARRGYSYDVISEVIEKLSRDEDA